MDLGGVWGIAMATTSLGRPDVPRMPDTAQNGRGVRPEESLYVSGAPPFSPRGFRKA